MRKLLLLTVLLTLVAGPAHACPWVFFGMVQDSAVPDGYWWKPIRTVKTAEECRAMVKTATGRPRVGLISWYHYPPVSEKSPEWLREVAALKPAGGADPWVGCLPSGYSPDEKR